MNIDDDSAEERLAAMLESWHEALLAGRTGAAESIADVPEELRTPLAQAQANLKLLADYWPNANSAPPPAPTAQVGRFIVEREIGSGGFGIVYLARDPLLNRAVALKVPRLEVLVSDAMRQRFEREARAAAALDHPNIVPVYEAGVSGAVCYIISAYCPGTNLAEWLRRQTAPVPAAAAAHLIATLADAVQHAHERGVLHRDLTPGNILLSARAPDGAALESYVPRITDFGMAKLTEGSQAQSKSGVLVGTPRYMAPEQAAGRNKDIVPATDVYALGAVLCELLTGRPPYEGETVLETLDQVRTAAPVALRSRRGDLSADLETICLKCLRKDAAERYSSAGALADDLRRHLAGQPIQARPLGRRQRFVRWCRRPERVRQSGFLVIGVAVGLLTFWTAAMSMWIIAGRLAWNLRAVTFLSVYLAFYLGMLGSGLRSSGRGSIGALWLGIVCETLFIAVMWLLKKQYTETFFTGDVAPIADHFLFHWTNAFLTAMVLVALGFNVIGLYAAYWNRRVGNESSAGTTPSQPT